MPLLLSRYRPPRPVVKATGPQDAATERAMMAAILLALGKLQDAGDYGPSEAAVLASIQSGNVTAALASFDFASFGVDWNAAVLQPLQGVFLAKALTGTADLGASATLGFDVLEPLAIAWAEKHSAALVTQVTQEVRQNVRSMIVAAQNGKATVASTSRLLRTVVPLSPRGSAAVMNTYTRTLEASVRSGSTLAKASAEAEKLSSRQAKRLLNSRASTIARTEIMSSSNAGRYQGWSSSINAGFASTSSRKEWIAADPDDDCADADGEIVPWDEDFSVGVSMPPLHPNCRCTAVLLPPDGGDPISDPDTEPGTVSNTQAAKDITKASTLWRNA